MHIVRVKMRRPFAGSAVALVVVMGCTSAAWAQEAPAPPAEPTPPAAAEPASPPPAPPSEPGIQWSLDARAGLPVLKEGDTRLAADVAAGVRGKTFGLDVRGSAGTFDFVGANGAFSQTDRAEGSLEGFIRFGTPAFTPEVRIYGTTINVPGAAFTDDDSVLGRGSLLLGLRGVTPGVAYNLLLGGGMQVEARDTLQAPTTANATIAIDDSQQVRSRLEARVRLRVPFYHDNLAFRLIQDASLFRLTRDESAIRVDTRPSSAGPTQTSSSVSVQNIESRTRLALDIEALAFGPFRPTIFAGLDVVSQSSDVGDNTAIVPLAGIGLVNPDDKK